MIKIYSVIILIVMLLLSGWFIERQKSEILTLSKDNLTLVNEVLNLKEQSLVRYKQVLDSQLRYDKLNQDLIKSEESLIYLRGIFNKHDFGNLLSKKPQLITNRMIKGTAKVLEDLENASN